MPSPAAFPFGQAVTAAGNAQLLLLPLPALLAAALLLGLLLALVIWARAPRRFAYALRLPRDVDRGADAVAPPADYELPEGVLVTGGAGFLGAALVQALASQPPARVRRVVAVDLEPFAPAPAPADARVEYARADAADARALARLMAGGGGAPPVRLVFHAAGARGTEAVVAACRAHRAALVFTSSAAVVLGARGARGAGGAGVGEADAAYPAQFADPEAAALAAAERLVLAAGAGAGTPAAAAAAAADPASAPVAAVALRPHLLYGPGDRELLPALAAAARAGRGGVLVGDGESLADFTFVRNAVHAHLLAGRAAARVEARAPGARAPDVSGRAFFVTDGEPRRFWEFVNELWLGLGFDSSTLRLPAWAAAAASGAAVALCRRPPFAFAGAQLRLAALDRVFSIAAARRELGYAPLWSAPQAAFLTLRAFQPLRNKRPSRLATEKARAGNLVALGLVDDIYSFEARASGAEAAARLERRNAAVAAMAKGGRGALEPLAAAEVARHDRRDDLWLIIDGLVYDLTDYVDNHPGGDSILKTAGRESSAGFHGDQHPSSARDLVRTYLIGRLDEAAAAALKKGE